MIIIAAVACWIQSSGAIPVINIPSPVMPNPNARDDYQKAYHAFVPYHITTPTGPLPLSFGDLEGKDIAQMLAPKSGSDAGQVPALKGYIFVPGRGLSSNAARHGAGENSNDPRPTLAELRELVRLNEPAFAALRAGFRNEFRETPMRSFFAAGNSDFSYYRSLARRLAIAAQVKRLSGDWNGAANTCLDGIRFGSDIPRGGNMIGMLVGIATEAIDREGLEETIDHLNAAQARAAAQRLDEVERRHTAYADVLQEEVWSTQAGLLELFDKPNWAANFAQ